MSRRHASRRRRRGEKLDPNRRLRVMLAAAQGSRRLSLLAARISGMPPQRPLYRVRARGAMRRMPGLVVRLSADIRAMDLAFARATEAMERFSEACRAYQRQQSSRDARADTP